MTFKGTFQPKLFYDLPVHSVSSTPSRAKCDHWRSKSLKKGNFSFKSEDQGETAE